MNPSDSAPKLTITSSHKWLVLLGFVCRIIVAFVFLTAGILKSFDPDGFAYQIESYGIISGILTYIAALFFIVVEFLIAIALLINYRPKITFTGAGILLFFFIIVTGWAWTQGKTEGCGCFGSLASRTPAEVIIEDIFLLGGLFVSWLSMKGNNIQNLQWKNRLFLASLVFAVALPFLGPRMPVDSIVTDLKIGADLKDLSVSDIDADLTEGEYLVVLLDEECEQCEKIVEDLNRILNNSTAPELVGILVGNRDNVFEFVWKYGVIFNLGYAPREEVGNLYRKLPKAFLLKDGIVEQVWNDLPIDLFNE